jgi:A/G-specific adenine glycosylase
MLQATFAAKVVPVYKEFVARYPSAHRLAHASVSDIENIIRPLGLLGRAHILLEIGTMLVTAFNGAVPQEDKDLRSLPRVGDYTAGAVRSFGFGLRAAIPDTNVIRLLQRFFGLHNPRKSHRGSPPKALRDAAFEVLPEGDSREMNYAMLDFGAIVCKSVKPNCRECPISARCHAYNAGEVNPV